MSEAAAPPDPARRRAFALLFIVLMSVAAGNTALQSVLPAVGREIGLNDTLVGAIFSLSAVFWTLSAPAWASASDRRGRKPLILIGLLGFGLSMAGLGLAVTAGLRHLAPPLVIFVAMLLTRSIFGLVGSASNPSAQAYVADHTTPAERTTSLATLASAFGLGTVIGPAVAPFLIMPVLGLASPMFVFSALAFVILAAVAKLLPADSSADREARVRKPHKRGFWRDPRVLPFLAFTFVLGNAQAINGQTLGFLIIDKLGMEPMAAQPFTGVAMMAGAISGLLAQWGLVRLLRMQPAQLLRWGAGLALVGNLITAFAPGYFAVVVAFAVMSVGYGFGRVGATAGSSLAVGQDEQGAVAGATTAVNGAAFIIAPIIGLALYEWIGPLPYALNAGAMALLVAYAFLNPTVRRASGRVEVPETPESADAGEPR